MISQKDKERNIYRDVYPKYVGYTTKLDGYANLFAYTELGEIGWNVKEGREQNGRR